MHPDRRTNNLISNRIDLRHPRLQAFLYGLRDLKKHFTTEDTEKSILHWFNHQYSSSQPFSVPSVTSVVQTAFKNIFSTEDTEDTEKSIPHWFNHQNSSSQPFSVPSVTSVVQTVHQLRP